MRENNKAFLLLGLPPLSSNQSRTDIENKRLAIQTDARIHLFSSIVDSARFSNPIGNVLPAQLDPGVLDERQTENKALSSMAVRVQGST